MSKAYPAQALLVRLAAREEQKWLTYLPSSVRLPKVPVMPTPPEPASSDAAPQAPGAIGVVGRIWLLSRHPHGCRWVQQAFQQAGTDAERAALAAELRCHVVEACRCPHANHVLQRCIATASPGDLNFVINEIAASSVRTIAKHKYGCRIVQRLIERCAPEQLEPITKAILQDLPNLSRHPYGTYVVQNLVANGTPADRLAVQTLVAGDLNTFCTDAHACAVVAAVMDACTPEDRPEFCERLLCEPDLPEAMAGMKHGATLVARALEGCRPGGFNGVAATLRSGAVAAQHGPVVLESLARLQRREGDA